MSEKTFVGIDVSKNSLDVCFLPEGTFSTFARDHEGITQLAQTLSSKNPELVVMEATGGLEGPVAASLMAEGLPVSVANPRRVRQYARASGMLAKTDRLDSLALAGFARDMRPRLAVARSAQVQRVRQLVSRRHQLVQMRTAEANRLKQAGTNGWKGMQKSLKRMVRFLCREILTLEAKITEAIRSDPALREIDRLLESTPGVGPVTARVLIAELPKLGTLGAKEVASLAGLAPFCRDSGTLKGRRMISGGRRRIRQTLYMAALTALKCNPDIREFHRRLIARGKPGKVALTACCRKLLVTLNAIVARGSAWTPKNA